MKRNKPSRDKNRFDIPELGIFPSVAQEPTNKAMLHVSIGASCGAALGLLMYHRPHIINDAVDTLAKWLIKNPDLLKSMGISIGPNGEASFSSEPSDRPGPRAPRRTKSKPGQQGQKRRRKPIVTPPPSV